MVKRTCFDHVDTDVFNARLNLLLHEICRNDMNSLDTHGILRRQGRGSSHGITAMRCQNLLIGLQATTMVTRRMISFVASSTLLR